MIRFLFSSAVKHVKEFLVFHREGEVTWLLLILHGIGQWFPSVEYTWVCAAEWDTSSGNGEDPTGDCK